MLDQEKLVNEQITRVPYDAEKSVLDEPEVDGYARFIAYGAIRAFFIFLTWLFLYLLGAFISWKGNPGDWWEGGRVLVAVIGSVGALVLLFMEIEEDEPEDKDSFRTRVNKIS